MFSEKLKWCSAGNKIKTKWGKNLDPKEVWQEYPRPQLERKEWLNLNGIWSYSITDVNSQKTDNFDGEILVPFSIESSLSGVMKSLNEKQILWYYKEFEIPDNWKDKNIIIHFNAVDWICELYINDNKIGEHSGGYSEFSFDITKNIKEGKNKILLKVFDPSDKGYQAVGKQTLNPNVIWYTSISGIWQTVWLEPVNEIYIQKLEINNDYDKKEIKINVKLNLDEKLPLEVSLLFKDDELMKLKGFSNSEIVFNIPDNHFHPWSPNEPNIYSFNINIFDNNQKIIDSIVSYTTLRKVEQKKDKNGIYRIYLNNKPLFNMGTLDQGYWPDGLYTPPSEEAMIYDINKLKQLGFNTIRKHIKIEPYRYYYYCDKIGMLVWQDMPSGDRQNNKWEFLKLNAGDDVNRSEESKNNYYKEWSEIIDNLKFFQCIIVWIPFNEGWGQFDTEKVVEFTKKQDSTRLINAASGGNHRICGNFLDLHSYPHPAQYLKVDNLINILGEFGGLALDIKGHTWKEDNWGYKTCKSKEEVTEKYEEYINLLINSFKSFSAAIYTQTTDVEIEINGLITYDRAEIKVIEQRIKAANEKIINSLE
jgi:beta-galactosidase/beta-glucuronidase